MPISIVFKKSTPTGISIPYLNNFSDQTDGQPFNDSMWNVDGTVNYDASATSYNSNWTGGLVFNSAAQESITSEFYLRGDFTDLEAAFSPTGGWNTTVHHGIFLRAVDLSEQNIALIYMQRSTGGNSVQVQSCNGGTWNYNHWNGTTDLEDILKISRSGSVFSVYQDNNLRYNITLNNASPDIKINILCKYWDSSSPSQDYLVDYISIDDADVTYSNIIDEFTGTDSNPVDSNKWTQTLGETFISNNKARQITGGGYNNNIATYKTPLTGEFAVLIDWDLISGPNSSWWQSKFKFGWDTDKAAFIGRIYNGAQQFRRAYNDGTGWSFTAISNSDTTGKFMATRINNTLQLWYDVGDGFVPWTVPVTCNNTDAVTLSLELQSSGLSSTWDWDNVKIIS